MRYFACTMMLDRGSIVRPGNWGRIVRLIGPNHQEWQREMILEEIRKPEFPLLPSRLESAFVIDALDEAQYYAANFAPLALLYKVTRIDHGAATHEADPGPHLVYGFLTTVPNAIAKPIHPKAMPVILTNDEECKVWMPAPCDEAKGAATASTANQCRLFCA
jgi:uncharacterized protein DUF2441